MQACCVTVGRGPQPRHVVAKHRPKGLMDSSACWQWTETLLYCRAELSRMTTSEHVLSGAHTYTHTCTHRHVRARCAHTHTASTHTHTRDWSSSSCNVPDSHIYVIRADVAGQAHGGMGLRHTDHALQMPHCNGHAMAEGRLLPKLGVHLQRHAWSLSSQVRDGAQSE